MAERDVLYTRLPPGMRDDLKLYALFTGRPVNEVVVRLIEEFLAGTGRDEIAAGMTRRAVERHGEALDKLATL